MRDAVLLQASEVLAAEEVGIADLDGITKGSGQRREERVKLGQKLAGVAAGLFGKGAELENEYGHALAIGLQKIQEGIAEQFRIEERGILLSSARAVARVRREDFHRDLFRNFKCVLERRRGGGEQALPVGFRRELVERKIAADDPR